MNHKKTTKTLKRIEELLDVSQQTIDEVEISDEDLIVQEDQYEASDEYSDSLVGAPNTQIMSDPEGDLMLFERQELKKTFIEVKRNLQRLVAHGNTLMDQVSGVQLEELKASELSAISELSRTISDQLKMMIEVFKDIIQIEKDLKSLGNPGPNIPEGTTVTQNNYNFTGTTQDILRQIIQSES